MSLLLICVLLLGTFAMAEDMPLIEWAPQTLELPMTGEIGDSWEEIIGHIDDGSTRERYAIGAWKPLDLGQYGVVNMQLAGFELDERADGQGKAATTWIAKELLEETHCMHSDVSSYEGWETSELRQWLRSEVWSTIPGVLRDRIVTVRKTQYSVDQQQTTEDDIWIPDLYEVFWEDSLYYDLFKDENANRVKTHNFPAAWWWLRHATNNIYAANVGSGGNNSDSSVNGSGGVVLGFCL